MYEAEKPARYAENNMEVPAYPAAAAKPSMTSAVMTNAVASS